MKNIDLNIISDIELAILLAIHLNVKADICADVGMNIRQPTLLRNHSAIVARSVSMKTCR